MLIYTRIVLIFAAIGLASMGVGGIASLFQGGAKNFLQGLVALILAVGIGYFWIKDWRSLSKCIKREELREVLLTSK
jgi:hypothetical protein